MFRCLSALLVLALLTGCQQQNRYSTYGLEILAYEGDADVLVNCCSSAMCLLAAGLNEQPITGGHPISFSHTASRSDTQQIKWVRNIWTMTCGDLCYRVEAIRAGKRPTMILLEFPEDDNRLSNHLTDLFANFSVKMVDSI